MTKTNMAAVVLLLLGLWGQFGRQAAESQPAYERPTAELEAAVAPITSILAGNPTDGQKLAVFYASLADVVERDAGRVITQAAELREINRRAGLLMFRETGMAGTYPELPQAIEKVLAEQIGLENTQLDPERRARAIAAFRAIAWAASQSGGSK